MNYELAKELKDSGFPSLKGIEDGPHLVDYAPTLEKLIEACGDGFFQLSHRERWEVEYATPDVHVMLVEGSTPTEAVARLWLALNKKV